MLPVRRFEFQQDGAATVFCGDDVELRPAGPNGIANLELPQLAWGVFLLLGEYGVCSWS